MAKAQGLASSLDSLWAVGCRETNESWPMMEPQVGWMGSKVLSHWMGSEGGVQKQSLFPPGSFTSQFLSGFLSMR